MNKQLTRSALLQWLSVLVILLGLISFALVIGEADLSLWQGILAMFGHGDAVSVFLVQELRLPRIIAALLSGAALATAGCLLQTLARNRLATPNIIGLDNGATAFAVASIVAVPISLAAPVLALTGAATAAALAFGLSAGAGARGYRFIVMGIGVGAVFGALTNFMLARTDMDSANSAFPWTVGSLNGRPEQAIYWLAYALVLGLPAALYLARSLNTMRLSEAIAIGLGTAVKRTRWLTLMVTVLLTGFSIALVGPVGIIALAAPEAARNLSAAHRVPVLLSAVIGSGLMLLADLVGQHGFSPIEVPVGLITAIVGGPYLLWILLRKTQPRTL